MLVNRAFGACTRREFDFMRNNRAVMARGDVTRMTDDVRHLKRTLDVEYVTSSGEEPAAT